MSDFIVQSYHFILFKMLSKSVKKFKLWTTLNKIFTADSINWNPETEEFEVDRSIIFKILLILHNLLTSTLTYFFIPNDILDYKSQIGRLEAIGTQVCISFTCAFSYFTQEYLVETFQQISNIDNCFNKMNIDPADKRSEYRLFTFIFRAQIAFNCVYFYTTRILYFAMFGDTRPQLIYKGFSILVVTYRISFYTATLTILRDRFKCVKKLTENLSNSKDAFCICCTRNLEDGSSKLLKKKLPSGVLCITHQLR